MVTDREQEVARQLIGDIVDRTGLSVTEIARRAGLAPSTLSRIFPVPVVKYTLSARSIGKLRTAFPDIAFGGFGGALHSELRSDLAVSAVRSERQPFHFAPPVREGMVPVYNLVPAPPSLRRELNELEIFGVDLRMPVGNWQMTISLPDPERFFVIYVAGEAMAPRIKAGEAILIDRARPPRINSDVAVLLPGDGPETLICIGTLTERTRTHVVIEQPHFEVRSEIALEDLEALHPIVARFSGPLLD